MNLLNRILSSAHAGKKPITIKNDENQDLSKITSEMHNNVLCPIFSVSNVTGAGLQKLKEFISLLKSRVSTSGNFGSPIDPVEYHIERVYQIQGIGIVTNGTLLAGTVKVGQNLLLGPTNKGGGFDQV